MNLNTLFSYANATQKALITGFQHAQKEFYTNLPNENNTNAKLEFIREPVKQNGGGQHTPVFLSVNNDVPAYARYGSNSHEPYWEYSTLKGGQKKKKYLKK